MAILADQDTKVIIQGITGREAASFTKDMLDYGTRVVAGVTPGKQGHEVHGVPVYDTVRGALKEHPVDASVISVPPGMVKGAVLEAIENHIKPIEGAVELLTKLSSAGRIFFVTARPDKIPIMNWVRNQLSKVDEDLIRLESTNHLSEKIPILLKNGVRYFVEDRLDTCYLLEEVSIVPIVFEQPWNRRPHHFPVVKNWGEISTMIRW